MTEPMTAEEWANELFFPEATVHVSFENGTTIFTHDLGWGSSLEKNVAIINQIQTQARREALKEAAEFVRTYAQDHLTVQPSFAKMAAAIRSSLIK